jgi:thioredoxin 1
MDYIKMKLLKFEASWCEPCKSLSKTMETIQFPYPVEVIDVDQNSAAAIEYGIRGVPHLILLDENNNIIKRVGGNVSKQILIEQLVETI